MTRMWCGVPPSIDDWLPEGHLARFVLELVEEVLDLEPFRASYTEARGSRRMTRA